jgi:hypothetical protein
MTNQKVITSHAVGEIAEQKAADGTSHADGAEEQHGHCRLELVIDGVGHEVHERDEYAQRSHEAGSIECAEPRGSNGFLDGQPLGQPLHGP